MKQDTLPLVALARFGIRGTICLCTGIAVILGYSIASRIAVAPAAFLPLTPIDTAIPLMPWTVWIYHLLGLGMVLSWFLVPNAWLARRLFMGVVVSTVTCMLVFIYFPTARMPQRLVHDDSLSVWALEMLWKIDDPTNCLPSLHVTLATLTAFTMREYGASRIWKLVPAIWAAAISISTLTTKQHYVLDVIAGVFVGWASYALIAWAARRDRRPFWSAGLDLIRLTDAREVARLDRLRTLMIRDAWSLDEVPSLVATKREPLPPTMVRFLNQVIYVEYLAAINFEFLARATKTDPKLREIYERFGREERQHAEGLRRLLRVNGAELQAPGFGCALLLHQFDSLDPDNDADAMLVALSIPVFETFLDAGTIPFVKQHEAIASPGLEALIANICRDESRHLAVNWAVSRSAARLVRKTRFARLRQFCNPKMWRAAFVTPFLATDVYAHAKRLGFDFRKLVPSFRRLHKLHLGYPELARFPLWWSFRIWVVVATAATLVVVAMDRYMPRFLGWLAKIVPALTDEVSTWFFDDALLERRGLPLPSEPVVEGNACEARSA